jgi:hypothetical protein
MSERKTFADVVEGDIVYVAVGDTVLGEVVKYVEHFKKRTHIRVTTRKSKDYEDWYTMCPKNEASKHSMPTNAVLFTEEAYAWQYLLDNAKKQYMAAVNTVKCRKNHLKTICKRMGLDVEDVITEGV